VRRGKEKETRLKREANRGCGVVRKINQKRRRKVNRGGGGWERKKGGEKLNRRTEEEEKKCETIAVDGRLGG